MYSCKLFFLLRIERSQSKTPGRKVKNEQWISRPYLSQFDEWNRVSNYYNFSNLFIYLLIYLLLSDRLTNTINSKYINEI